MGTEIDDTPTLGENVGTLLLVKQLAENSGKKKELWLSTVKPVSGNGKQSPSIKRSLVKVLEIASLNYFRLNHHKAVISIQWLWLPFPRSHKAASIIWTCIKWSLCTRNKSKTSNMMRSDKHFNGIPQIVLTMSKFQELNRKYTTSWWCKFAYTNLNVNIAVTFSYIIE